MVTVSCNINGESVSGGKEALLSIDTELEDFSRWLTSTLNTAPLLPQERAMLKTYLVYKLEQGA